MPRMASIFLKNAQYDKNFPDLVFSVKLDSVKHEDGTTSYDLSQEELQAPFLFFKTFFLFVQQSRLETLKSKTCELKHTIADTQKGTLPYYRPNQTLSQNALVCLSCLISCLASRPIYVGLAYILYYTYLVLLQVRYIHRYSYGARILSCKYELRLLHL